MAFKGEGGARAEVECPRLFVPSRQRAEWRGGVGARGADLAGLPEANRWGGWERRHPAALPRRRSGNTTLATKPTHPAAATGAEP